MLLKEARNGFLFDCECRHLAKGSIRNYRAETKFLMEFLELKQITEVEDAQNGYGATVRANFVVTFTFASKDTYSVALCTVS